MLSPCRSTPLLTGTGTDTDTGNGIKIYQQGADGKWRAARGA